MTSGLAMTKITFKKALRYAQKMHAGQTRAGGMPVWHHLLRVSETLGTILKETGEGSVAERKIIPIAALGHDILEDTKATQEEVGSVFGERGLELIRGMTNWLGDKNHGPYIKAMAAAEEAVRLIKLADSFDNFTSVAYNLTLLGEKWAYSYFLPIVLPMRQKIFKTRFVTYKKTAEKLMFLVDTGWNLLRAELEENKKKT